MLSSAGSREFNLCAYVTNFSLKLSPHARGYSRMCQMSILEYRICRPDSTIGSSGVRSRWWSRLVCLANKKEKQNQNPITSWEICQSISSWHANHSPYINLIGFDVSNRISDKRHLLLAHARQAHANPSQHGNGWEQCLQELRLHTMFLVAIEHRYTVDFDMAYRRGFQGLRDGFERFRRIIQMDNPITDFQRVEQSGNRSERRVLMEKYHPLVSSSVINEKRNRRPIKI